MSLLNHNKVNSKITRSSKDVTDFSKVGGLNHHLKTLRDLIIFPLLHGNVYSYFNIKAPRGVLFYGPPGTGKTLVAGALASEINKEGLGKVSFFQRKGADVLDKWVGESEKKLKDIFDKATKSRPSIIFFDELDGLAPIRSPKNDHIHSSIVATLLALMDGLDAKPGVIVIGATNRIETIDPALRRPGRFDKELYFPMPALEARKEILDVHTMSWKFKPNSAFFNHMAELTAGFCGADLQALCSEAVLCCIKRTYPSLQSLGYKCKVEAEALKIEETDFLYARYNLLPSSIKFGSKIRGLNSCIEPLLTKQLNKIISYIEELWPHFLQGDFKYFIGNKRYAGRMVISGASVDGVNIHLVPAILQRLDHLPVIHMDVRNIYENVLPTVHTNLPSLLLLSRIDEWWNHIEETERISILNNLEELHAGLPVFILATCTNDIPQKLQEYFYANSSIMITISKPCKEERENFFAPLFFDENILSLYKVLQFGRENSRRIKSEYRESRRKTTTSVKSKLAKLREDKAGTRCFCSELIDKISTTLVKAKKRRDASSAISKKIKTSGDEIKENLTNETTNVVHKRKIKNESSDVCDSDENAKEQLTNVLSDLVHQKPKSSSPRSVITYCIDHPIKEESSCPTEERSTPRYIEEHTHDPDLQKIYTLWQRTSWVTSRQMTIAHLELLYDVVKACIKLHKRSFTNLVQCLDETLGRIEKAFQD